MHNIHEYKMLLFTIAFAFMASGAHSSPSFTTEEFTFDASGLNLHGIISQPENMEAKSLIIIIPGHGPTNVVKGNWFYELRSKFTALGIAVVAWDKPGCGKSQGEFNLHQSVDSSADEVVDAIRSIRSNRVPGYERIGLWGVSRAGWIAPLAINKEPGIKFWISVSGTDAFESWGYLLRSNLALAGYSALEIETLHQEWIKGNEIFSQHGSYSEHQNATEALRKNEFYQKLTGQEYVGYEEGSIEFARESARYDEIQEAYISEGHQFDPESGLEIVIQNFDQILNKISIPVLAVFGDNDRHVDWRKTKALYERTMGRNEDTSLKIKVFHKADHSIRMSKTGGYFETMQPDYRQTPYADGYYQVMIDFLCSNKFCAESDHP